MSGELRVTTRSARVDRLRALAPRIALFGIVALLSLAGLRASLEGTPAAEPVRAPGRALDQGALAFAEGFARAYLAWGAKQPDQSERELAAYLSDELEPDGGLSPARGRRSVLWTTVEGDSLRGRRHTITIAAQTSAGLVHLAVPVERDRHGFLSVPAYPALVGPPATNTSARAPAEDEVEDPRLRAVVERALTNYLAGERRNLLADLAPEAVVSLPASALELRSAREITWARPGRTVAVLVEVVDAAGSGWTLRYELEVLKRERWYVRSLHVDPTQRGGFS